MRPASSGADAALVQGEHGALRDDEQAAQLGQPGDHVVGQRVGGAAPRACLRRSVDERHHRDGGAPVRGGHARGARGCLPGAGAKLKFVRSARSFVVLWRPPGIGERGGSRGLRLRTGGRVVARCSSPSRIRPRRASAVSSSSCTRRSNGASSQPLLEMSSEACVVRTRCARDAPARRVAAAEPAPLRGEPAVEGRSCGRSPVLRESRRRTTATQFPQPLGRKRLDAFLRGARATRSRRRSSRRDQVAIVSPCVSTRRWPGSSTRLLILLRHQRSSPRGSLGTSHSSSHSWLRGNRVRRERPDKRAGPAPCVRRAARGRRRHGGWSGDRAAAGSGMVLHQVGRTLRFHGHFHACYHAGPPRAFGRLRLRIIALVTRDPIAARTTMIPDQPNVGERS